MADQEGTPDTRDVPVANLLFDQLNPRLDEQTSQREAHRAIVVEQGDKLLALADDIAERGLDPSTLSIGIPDAQDPARIIILEGNRRLAALRSLTNPDTVIDLLEPRQAKRLRDLSAKYLLDPVRTVRCIVYPMHCVSGSRGGESLDLVAASRRGGRTWHRGLARGRINKV